MADGRVAREVMCGEGLGLIQAFVLDDRGDLWRAALFLEKPAEMPKCYSPRADGIRMARFEPIATALRPFRHLCDAKGGGGGNYGINFRCVAANEAGELVMWEAPRGMDVREYGCESRQPRRIGENRGAVCEPIEKAFGCRRPR